MDSKTKVLPSCILPPPAYPKKVGEELQPRYHLTESQESLVQQFRQNLVDIDETDRQFCDKACLVRYLRARDYNLIDAEKLLRETLAWRKEINISSLDPRTFEAEQLTGKIYLHGTDRTGRPVMYQKPRLQNSKDYALQVKQIAYFMERNMNAMNLECGVEQGIVIFDFNGYSIWNAPPFSQTKEVLNVILNHYPERLGSAYMMDAPYLFNALWNIVKPFLPAATQAKIQFVSSNGTFGARGTMSKELADKFDDDMLEEAFGGLLSSSYDHEAYWAAELAIWDQTQLKST